MAQEQTNPFLLRKKFPDVKSILKGGSSSEEYKDYLFVLDTNTLLAPYGVEKNSIDKIKNIYTKLLASDLLYIPTHALLEFAENRSGKIRDIFTSVDTALSQLPGWQGIDYPILHDLGSFKKLLEFKKVFDENKNQYKKILQELKDEIVKWNWQDPISKMYSEIFKDEVFIDTPETEDELLKELEARSANNIPPGFKDKGKSENSAGDLIIWKSIIALGKAKSKDIVFVTNDAKADWFVQGNKKAIVTRFELVDEYYRETNGKRFTCMNFSSFLELQGAEEAIVNEVEFAAKREAVKAEAYPSFKETYPSPKFGEFASVNTLDKIPGYLRYLLKHSPISEDFFLDKEAYNIMGLFLEQFKEDRPKYPIELDDALEILANMASNIRSASFEIEYQFVRMKRDTSMRRKQLQELCVAFLNAYQTFAGTANSILYSINYS